MIDLYESTSLRWSFTNQFGDTVYSEIQLARRGLWKGYFDLDNANKLDKFVLIWVDRERRYFTSNTSSLRPDLPYTRDRIIQVDDSPNADPVCVEFEIN